MVMFPSTTSHIFPSSHVNLPGGHVVINLSFTSYVFPSRCLTGAPCVLLARDELV